MINDYSFSVFGLRYARQGSTNFLQVSWIYNSARGTNGNSHNEIIRSMECGQKTHMIPCYRPPTLKIYDRLSRENFYSSPNTRGIILFHECVCRIIFALSLLTFYMVIPTQCNWLSGISRDYTPYFLRFATPEISSKFIAVSRINSLIIFN